jgi:hypothetical protein
MLSAAVNEVLFNPGKRMLFVGLSQFDDVLGLIDGDRIAHVTIGSNEARIELKNSSELLFLEADKIRGRSVDYVFIDELVEEPL